MIAAGIDAGLVLLIFIVAVSAWYVAVKTVAIAAGVSAGGLVLFMFIVAVSACRCEHCWDFCRS